MTRRLLNVIIIFSLLLFVAIVAAWLWSYHRADIFEWRWVENGPDRAAWGDAQVRSTAGGVAVSVRTSVTEGGSPSSARFREPLGLTWKTYSPPSYPRRVDGPRFDFDAWGFVWDRRTMRSTDPDEGRGEQTERYVAYAAVAPYWALALAAGALPAYSGMRVARRRAARRREARGLCGRCGYDVRASPGRCPECGNVAAASSTVS